MKYDTIVTFVDKTRIENHETGEASDYCKVTIQVPITKTEKNPYAFGTVGKDYFVNVKYYDKFKEIYAKGAKFSVTIGFKPTYDKLSRRRYYKDYIFAIDDKEL